MKTPAFWNDTGLRSTLLLPLAGIYEMASVWRRILTRPARLAVPVICIGNLTAGGAGKTPVALAIGQILKEKHEGVFFLSRGYGGKLTGPLLVDRKRHAAAQVGDEPLLLAGILPTVVAKNRLQGARFAIAHGAKAIVMDDGFQNPQLVKTLSLVVIDGQLGFGNGRLLPAGPLREPPEPGLKRAHGVIIVNPSSHTPPVSADKPALIAKTAFHDSAQSLKGKAVLAFSGIAYPQKFFNALSMFGARLTQSVSFPDHYAYTNADIKRLAARARKQQALLVTTTKDAVRLPPPARKAVTVAEMTLRFDSLPMLTAMLDYAFDAQNL